MAQPAGDRRGEPALQVFGDIEVGRRPRPAVQIFVATAHGQVRPRPVEVDHGDAGGVAEVPEGPGPGRPRGGVDRGHVPDLARAEMGVAQQHHRHVRADGGDEIIAGHLPGLADRPGDIEIGRELTLHSQHRAPLGPRLHRRREQLVEVHGGGVGDDHFMRSGADQRRDLGAHAGRRADPVPAGPAGDQVPAPLGLDHLGQPRRRGPRRRAQRIAGHVDQALRQVEGVAVSGQGV